MFIEPKYVHTSVGGPGLVRAGGWEPDGIVNKSSHFILTSLNRVVGEKGYCTTAELRYFVVRT